MTHNSEVKERLFWLTKKEWYGRDSQDRVGLRSEAPPEARESFKKWAAYQDSLKGRGYDYTLEIF